MEGGALFALLPEQAAGIHLASRLLETSRRAQPNGIDIPMIREDRFFKQPSTFLGIPSGPGVRSRLRVYDPRRVRGSTVRVEILKSDGTASARHISYRAMTQPSITTRSPPTPSPALRSLEILQRHFRR